MFLEDVVRRSALAQSQLLRGRAISVEELTRAYLERTERLDPRLSAFVQFTPERALRSARALDRAHRRGPRGLLWGLPTAMKDIHLVRGMFMRLGSRAFRHFLAPVDDVSTAAVRRAGMVITGKLATSELGILPFIDTDIHPPTRNPWALDRYSGGSSGGSSAAIAAGLLPLAVASDGGGSIRIPAAFCGLVGHKPTRGFVPSPFVRFEALELSVVGPHARSVDDAAALIDTLRGVEGEDGSLLPAIQRPPPRLRIRFTTDNPVTSTEPAIGEAVRRVARLLSSMGHEVEEGTTFQGQVEDFMPMYYYLAHNMFVPFEEGLQPTSRWLREQGAQVTLEAALHHREFFRVRVDEWFEGVDVWVTPTVAMAPPPVGVWNNDTPDGRMLGSAPIGAFTASINASGNPATTVPVQVPEGGPPAGVQLIAPRGHDERLLSLARALLEALGTPLVPLAPLAEQA